MKIKEFVNKYKNSTEIANKYKTYFSIGKNENIAEIQELLRLVIDKEDEDALDCLLIIASEDGLNKTYTSIFKELLEKQWHYSIEDIIMYMGEIKDEDSVESIFKATKIEENNYIDEPCPITKKCIWTLGLINTEQAIEKIRLLSLNRNINVKEAALLELDKLRK